MDSRKLIAKSDIVILVLILLLALIGLIAMKLQKDGDTVLIAMDGKELYSIELSSVKQPETLEIKGKDGINALIEVSDRGACFLECTCPDKTCVRTGMVSKDFQSAVCLPGRISIAIKSGNEPDGVTY